MDKERIKYLSFFSLLIGTLLSYLSIIIAPHDLWLIISFLTGFFGITGLFYVTKPNSTN